MGTPGAGSRAVLCSVTWCCAGKLEALGWLEHEAVAVPDAAAMALNRESRGFGSWALHRLPGSIKGISFWYGNFSAAVHTILLATVFNGVLFLFLFFPASCSKSLGK